MTPTELLVIVGASALGASSALIGGYSIPLKQIVGVIAIGTACGVGVHTLADAALTALAAEPVVQQVQLSPVTVAGKSGFRLAHPDVTQAGAVLVCQDDSEYYSVDMQKGVVHTPAGGCPK